MLPYTLQNNMCNVFLGGNREIRVYYTGWISSNRLHLLLAKIYQQILKKYIFLFSCVTICWSKNIVATFLLLKESWDMSIQYRLNICKWAASSVNWHFTKKTLKYHISFFMCYRTLFKKHSCTFFHWGNHDIWIYQIWIFSLHSILISHDSPNIKRLQLCFLTSTW